MIACSIGNLPFLSTMSANESTMASSSFQQYAVGVVVENQQRQRQSSFDSSWNDTIIETRVSPTKKLSTNYFVTTTPLNITPISPVKDATGSKFVLYDRPVVSPTSSSDLLSTSSSEHKQQLNYDDNNECTDNAMEDDTSICSATSSPDDVITSISRVLQLSNQVSASYREQDCIPRFTANRNHHHHHLPIASTLKNSCLSNLALSMQQQQQHHVLQSSPQRRSQHSQPSSYTGSTSTTNNDRIAPSFGQQQQSLTDMTSMTDGMCIDMRPTTIQSKQPVSSICDSNNLTSHLRIQSSARLIGPPCSMFRHKTKSISSTLPQVQSVPVIIRSSSLPSQPLLSSSSVTISIPESSVNSNTDLLSPMGQFLATLQKEMSCTEGVTYSTMEVIEDRAAVSDKSQKKLRLTPSSSKIISRWDSGSNLDLKKLHHCRQQQQSQSQQHQNRSLSSSKTTMELSDMKNFTWNSNVSSSSSSTKISRNKLAMFQLGHPPQKQQEQQKQTTLVRSLSSYDCAPKIPRRR